MFPFKSYVYSCFSISAKASCLFFILCLSLSSFSLYSLASYKTYFSMSDSYLLLDFNLPLLPISENTLIIWDFSSWFCFQWYDVNLLDQWMLGYSIDWQVSHKVFFSFRLVSVWVVSLSRLQIVILGIFSHLDCPSRTSYRGSSSRSRRWWSIIYLVINFDNLLWLNYLSCPVIYLTRHLCISILKLLTGSASAVQLESNSWSSSPGSPGKKEN